MTKVTLPDGCSGLEFADGTKVNGRAGTAEVSDDHARQIDKSWYRSAGVMRSGQQFSFGTRVGARCAPCNRTWNAWSVYCPRCGAATTRSSS
jgi:hypothetical protein